MWVALSLIPSSLLFSPRWEMFRTEQVVAGAAAMVGPRLDVTVLRCSDVTVLRRLYQSNDNHQTVAFSLK